MKYLFLIIVILYCSNISSQVQQEWIARYNGIANGADAGFSIAVDQTGNVYVTGWSYNGSNSDYMTIKYNSAGIQQWAQNYNGQGNDNDQAVSIALDTSGNVYVTGFSWGGSSKDDYLTIKYSPSGIQQWVQRYDGMGGLYDEASSMSVDNSGNVYVTGFSYGGGTNDDYATIKYNSSGVQQWVKRYNGTDNGDDWANSIALDNSGNVYVTGFSYGSGTYDDYATIKYNSAGTELWVQRYNGTSDSLDIATSVTADNSGNVYVTGYSFGNGTSSDYATVKYNSSGVQQWAQRYNNPSNSYDIAHSIAIDNLGNILVTGSSNSDYTTIKYSSSGVQQWIQAYNGPSGGNDYANRIIADSSGNVYVTGSSSGNGTGDDYATIKYNPTGIQQWIQRYNGPGNSLDVSHSISVDISGNIYVTGRSTGSGTNIDFATIKYNQPIGITPISNQIPSEFKLEQNYPNPFNPKTIIKFQLPINSFVRLAIYDMLGREVETLVNQHLNTGTYKVDWDAAKYSSGIYYYLLLSGGYNDTKKMILIK